MAVNTLGGGGVVSGVAKALSQISKIVVTAADVASNTQDKYFFINSTTTDHYIRMNVASGGTDPSLPNKTAGQATYATNASISTIATAIATAINALSGTPFKAVAYNDTIYIHAITAGVCPMIDAGITTNLTVSTITVGQVAPSGLVTVYLFTTPATADYAYKVVMTPTTKGTGSGITFTNPSSVAAPLLVGPSTPVSICGTSNATNDTYSVVYTYLAYKLT